jgi:hypothetical protein
MLKRFSLVLAVCAVTALSLASSALATAQDYSSLTDGFGSELSAAVPVALAAVGLFIGVMLAYKVVRRILRA